MYTDKKTKNIITKETIAKELLTKSKKSSQFFIIVSVVWVTLLGIIFFSVYSFALKNSNNGVFAYIVYFVSMLICLFPLIFFIMFISASGKERKKLKNGQFFVITDEVVYKEEKEITKRRDTILIKKVIHFYRCGEIKVNSTWYQITDEKDIFYMVVRDQDSQNVLKCYPAKLYKYVE